MAHKKGFPAHDEILKKNKNKKYDDIIKPGITTTTTHDIIDKNLFKIKQHNKNLLRTLINDEGLLDLVTNEENLVKIRNRFVHTLTGTKSNGEKLFEAKSINKTTQETLTQLEYEKGTNILQYSDQQLKQMGFNTPHILGHGILDNITITTQFIQYKKQ